MARRDRHVGPSGGGGGGHKGPGNPNTYPLALRLRVVEEVLERKTPMAEVPRAFGLSVSTVREWVVRFRAGGLDELKPKPVQPPPPRRPGPRRAAVVEAKQQHPEQGARRIRDELRRFKTLGVSATKVLRILHEEGLIAETPERTGPREHPPRRFERAEPNQLWQSDIFTFLLRRQERLYVAAFLDDHSRFLVSVAVAHHQRSSLMMDALQRGIAAYGPPREILTDQGRQYTAWRGETEFEEELRRQGIRHVKSRRKLRERPSPKWLLERQELDEVAKRRCLMVLSVLSGEKPVTTPSSRAKVSRGTYYQLETRALKAMLAALAPGASQESSSAADGPLRRVAELEQKLLRAEQEKRRAERLLLLTRKLVKPGPVKAAAGRPPAVRASRSSTTSGSARSRSSSGTTPASSPQPNPSTPTPAGGAGP